MKLDIRKLYSDMMSKYSIYFILIIMIIVSSFLNSNFLTFANFSNISSQLAVTTILACGATMLIISGMIDLSCGSVLALAGVLSVASYKATNNMILAILVAIIVGVICNLINGIMITKFKVPPFIATLAMLTMARGAALKYTNGQNIYQIGKYTVLGQGTLPGGIPISVLFLILFVILTWYILTHKKLGRELYAIGGNEEAAIASGINVNKSKIEVFIINGIFVGFNSGKSCAHRISSDKFLPSSHFCKIENKITDNKEDCQYYDFKNYIVKRLYHYSRNTDPAKCTTLCGNDL